MKATMNKEDYRYFTESLVIIKEMNDMYMSDIDNLERIKYRLTDLLNLERDGFKYIKGSN